MACANPLECGPSTDGLPVLALGGISLPGRCFAETRDDRERARANDGNACRLLGIGFTTAIGILVRSREKGLVERDAAIAKLATLARHGRYKNSIIEDARMKLEGEQ
jgi:hypothetical protein